ncbi:MAG: NUDIX hydrolase [Huintestinicola sp.]|uniref:NUDIX hydrolase n=1 Tax=Huintestinicola sp. TaxID=2981661 RepID=UPI003F12A815
MQGNTDCCFRSGNDWFRYRVGAIIISGEYALFAYGGEDYFYSVGGGVHIGEYSENAVLRETMEETGLELEIERPLCIVENFFIGMDGSIKGLDCHTLEFYYLMKPAEKVEINVKSITGDGVSEKMCWLPISRLEEYDIRPKIAVRLAMEPPERFEIFVNEQREIIQTATNEDAMAVSKRLIEKNRKAYSKLK